MERIIWETGSQGNDLDVVRELLDLFEQEMTDIARDGDRSRRPPPTASRHGCLAPNFV